MKILVTGGAGFIGSNLVRLLIKEKGATVINLDKLTYAGNPESLADLKDDPNYHFEYGDLATPFDKPGTPPAHLCTFLPSHCDQKSLVEIFKHYQPDAVIHLAAESHVDRSIDGPGEFIQTNIVGTYNLLQASLQYWCGLPEAESEKVGTCEGGNVQSESSDLPTFEPSHLPTRKSFRFLHVSTDEVYGSLESDAPAFTEASPSRPNSPYAASKAAADHLVHAWRSTYGLPTIITCCGNNYGPNQHPEKLIPKVIVCCHKQEPIPIYGDGSNIRDWIHVDDHAEALYTVLTKGRVGETYNIGANNEQTNLDLVKKLCEILEDEIRGKADSLSDLPTFRLSHLKSFKDLITFVTDRPGHDMRYAIDARKIRDELGWEPKEDFESGFRKTVQWYLENQDWWQYILSGDYQLGRLGKN